MLRLVASLAASLLALSACADLEDEIEDGDADSFPSGKADGGIEEGSPEALGVLSAVNAPLLDAAQLKAGARVTSRVAANIMKHRSGLDGIAGSADDNPFDTLAELDKIPYVGPATLDALLAWARGQGLVKTGPKVDVIFSPQVAAASHNARIATMIDAAQHDIDISIYSYSDAGITEALKRAVARGVRVRFLFETANADRKITDATARANSKSGKLEAIGIDVRYVNQINHHKFIIVDGPRDDRARAATAKIATGSANFSSTGGTVYDENTFFIEGSEELGAAYQQEFDKLWKGSRDFVGPAPAQGHSTGGASPVLAADDPGIRALFTSPNFTPSGTDGTTWRANKDSMAMADAWVSAIERATTSIHIAHTHVRLRPVVEALIAKRAADPSIDIKLYTDQQEFISQTGDAEQRVRVEACLTRASTSAQERDCRYNSFLFTREIDEAGIAMRLKSYAYRWNASFAIQQHSKYMIIDGSEVFSGSYNWSMNSEHGTFENAIHVSGPQFKPVVDAFEANFAAMWDTRRSGASSSALAELRGTISSSATIPLVFEPMALTYTEFESLRALIRANCTAADSEAFRENPAAHKTCAR